MLNRSRQEVNNRILSAVYNTPMPACSVGWPPFLAEYIKELVENVSIAVVDSIYTEQELDEKIDNTLLKTQTDSIKD